MKASSHWGLRGVSRMTGGRAGLTEGVRRLYGPPAVLAVNHDLPNLRAAPGALVMSPGTSGDITGAYLGAAGSLSCDARPAPPLGRASQASFRAITFFAKKARAAYPASDSA